MKSSRRFLYFSKGDIFSLFSIFLLLSSFGKKLIFFSKKLSVLFIYKFNFFSNSSFSIIESNWISNFWYLSKKIVINGVPKAILNIRISSLYIISFPSFIPDKICVASNLFNLPLFSNLLKQFKNIFNFSI